MNEIKNPESVKNISTPKSPVRAKKNIFKKSKSGTIGTFYSSDSMLGAWQLITHITAIHLNPSNDSRDDGLLLKRPYQFYLRLFMFKPPLARNSDQNVFSTSLFFIIRFFYLCY